MINYITLIVHKASFVLSLLPYKSLNLKSRELIITSNNTTPKTNQLNSNAFKRFTPADIQLMDKRSRAMFINSLSGFKSANLIATSNCDGKTNVAMFSSVVHLGASPALVGFIMRPNQNATTGKEAQRHTLKNIMATKQYTINQVSSDFWQAAHQTSARYTEDESEFDKVGLTCQYIEDFKAPFVTESYLKYALTLIEIVPIKHNNTQMIIGEISQVICIEKAIQLDGYIDIEMLNTVCVSGLDSYHTTKRLSRLSYAKR